MRMKIDGSAQRGRIGVMAILLAGSCLLTYYFHAVLRTGIIFTHFFYIPIILASLWWGRRGTAVAFFLAVFLIVSDTLFAVDAVNVDDYLRALMFILISVVVAMLSEHIATKEQESKRAYGELAQIFNTAGDGMWVIDKEFNIVRINDRLCTLCGVSKAETVNKKCFEVLHSSLCRTSNCPLQRILAVEERASCDLEQERKDGTRVSCIVTATPFRGPDGELIGIVEDLRDITDRKRAEEQAVLLATAIEQAAEGITITDKDGTIRYVNPAFERISGYTHKDIIGQHHGIFKSSRHDEAFYKAMWSTLSRGEVWTGHILDNKGDGTPYEVESSIAPIRDSAGTITNYVAVMRDVTHEVELEAQLRQVQKMEAIGTLAGGIAHDFNNILGAIMGYTEIALYYVPEGTPGRRNLEQVLKASYRGKGLVKQIITFSRRSEQERQPMQITPVVKEALKFLRASLPATIEIRQNINADSGIVLADPIQIHQVLMNLCSNAAYAMRDTGGVLEIDLGDVNVDAELAAKHPDLNPGSYLRLTVKDTGCGMDREVMERIFEPFFTTKSPGEGTGMGLAVVHGIVKSYGGAIAVHSEPGEGSVFEMFLPRVEGVSPPQVVSAEPIPKGNERILFVDDEKDLVDMMLEMLERLGYRVVGRTSGIDALEVFRSQSDEFDLVITDQTMPHMTGADLAKELMCIRPDIPIILCTGFSEVITPEDVKALGIREFLMKPITTREIAQAVRRVLNGKM